MKSSQIKPEKSRGGKRPGAGRKKGAKDLATIAKEQAIKEAVAEARAAGVTPLEVMTEAMREIYYGPDGKGKNALAAFNLAKEIAPYMHAKLTSVKADVKTDETVTVVHRAVFEIDALMERALLPGRVEGGLPADGQAGPVLPAALPAEPSRH